MDAVAELATLLVQAAGSPYQVSRAQVENVDAEALTKQLVTEEFKAVTKYPLEKEKSAYSENFCSFWSKLVLQAGDVVFDEFLMPHVTAWVEMLSSWEVRSFRHAGTVAGNQLVTALIALRNKRIKQSEVLEAMWLVVRLCFAEEWCVSVPLRDAWHSHALGVAGGRARQEKDVFGKSAEAGRGRGGAA